MYKAEEKYCPGCGNKFECKAGDILNCQCTKINIADDTRKFLQTTFYNECLCNNCISAINDMVQFSKQYTFRRKEN